MKIIQPFLNVDILGLLADKKILKANDKNIYRTTIFPQSTDIQILNQYNPSNLITKLDDSFFSDFYIMKKINQNVYNDDNTTRDYIKCVEIGDIDDSVKRYTNLDKPIDCSTNAQEFLNLTNLETIENNPQENIIQKNTQQIAKYNDKTTIIEIFKWAKRKGIKYIYCIIEHRPNIISYEYTTPFVYYTIKGK